MFCPKCGKENPNGARSCGICGEEFPQEIPWGSLPASKAGGGADGGADRGAGGGGRGVRTGVAAAVVAVLAIAAVLVFGLFGSKAPKSPSGHMIYAGEQLAHAIADNMSGSVTSSMTQMDDSRNKGRVQLEIDSSLLNLVSAMMGGSDMGWLSRIAVDFDASQKDGEIGADFSASLGGKEILSMNMFMDQEIMCVKIPELSSQYFEMDLDDVISDYSTRVMVNMMMDSSYQEGISSISGLLSDKKAMGKMLETYIGIVTNNLENVEKSTERLSADGVTGSYTMLKGEISAEAAGIMQEEFYSALRSDEQLEELIRASAAINGQDPDEVYQELQDELERGGSGNIQISDPIELTVWVDGKSNVRGFLLAVPDEGMELRYACPQDGKDVGFTLSITDNGSETYSLTGSGTVQGGRLNGAYTLCTDGSEIAEIGLVDFKGDSNAVKGRVLLTPSRALAEEIASDMAQSGIPSSLVRNLSLVIDLDTSGSKSSVAYRLVQSDDELISITVENEISQAGNISEPSGTVSAEDWANDVFEGGGMTDLMDRLADVGVPLQYLMGLG